MAMTQPAASKALAELESILEAPLLERTKTGLVPNEFGRTVLRHPRVLAAGVASLSEELDQVRTGKSGTLSVGVIMGAIPALVAPVVSQLHDAHPGLAIEPVENTSARMLKLLDDGQLDLVIGRASVSGQPDMYHYQPIWDEPVSVVAGPAHPLHGAENRSFNSLADYQWITYPVRMPMPALLERELDLAGMQMPPAPISTAWTFVTVALLQQSAKLVSVLPSEVADMFARRGMLTILPIDLKSKSQTVGVVTRANGNLSKAAQVFLTLLRAHARAAAA